MNKSKCFIDSKYLLTLIKVAKYRSVTAAAESLFMTQPAVSQHIKKIENTIGVEVFDRRGGFELTQHGKILFDHAKKMLSMNESLFDQLKSINLGRRLNIAVEDVFCPRVIECVLRQFKTLDYRELSFTSFSLEHCPPVEEYDLIFTTERLPRGRGTSHHLDTVSYSLVRSSGDMVTPTRVIFSSTLTKSYVRSVLTEHEISLDNVVYWHTTSSSTLINSELAMPGTIAICPDWSVTSDGYLKTPLSQLINMYIWSSDDSMTKIASSDVPARVRQTCKL
ncbi:LysR family transcriptional regulator [Vibrio zhanjiangensis]|uniref:LysR family transcriptional regulator n=1 Tax=Vibrio zhanjiangensis TaxID=1046128 RepID=A0ABQ6EWU4_9VIBR|nr:LysR family transcriptional regulator [Vibrio zhanjiangensis]GLT17673.1 LysR family transcriptional regulator [Vibrio zhanjiangensis]